MSEIEYDDRGDASHDPHQDRPTQGTLADDSPVRTTRTKTYSDSSRGREKRRRREISEEDATTLPPDRNITYPVPYNRPDWSFGEA